MVSFKVEEPAVFKWLMNERESKSKLTNLKGPVADFVGNIPLPTLAGKI